MQINDIVKINKSNPPQNFLNEYLDYEFIISEILTPFEYKISLYNDSNSYSVYVNSINLISIVEDTIDNDYNMDYLSNIIKEVIIPEFVYNEIGELSTQTLFNIISKYIKKEYSLEVINWISLNKSKLQLGAISGFKVAAKTLYYAKIPGITKQSGTDIISLKKDNDEFHLTEAKESKVKNSPRFLFDKNEIPNHFQWIVDNNFIVEVNR